MDIDETRIKQIVREMLRSELQDMQIHPNQLLAVRIDGNQAQVGDSIKFDGESVRFEP